VNGLKADHLIAEEEMELVKDKLKLKRRPGNKNRRPSGCCQKAIGGA
jgi:hypothetical protein